MTYDPNRPTPSIRKGSRSTVITVLVALALVVAVIATLGLWGDRDDDGVAETTPPAGSTVDPATTGSTTTPPAPTGTTPATPRAPAPSTAP